MQLRFRIISIARVARIVENGVVRVAETRGRIGKVSRLPE